jgi:hypothetical protein
MVLHLLLKTVLTRAGVQYSARATADQTALHCCLKQCPANPLLLQVRPTQFGLVDSHSLFVAFEGRAAEDTPLFKVRPAGCACGDSRSAPSCLTAGRMLSLQP